jgi:hypothetical protein
MRTRFSLKTLVLFVLTLGAGVSLALIWQPWQHRFTLRPGGKSPSRVAYAADGHQLVTQTFMPELNRSRTALWDNLGHKLHHIDWGFSESSYAKFCENDRFVQLSSEFTPGNETWFYQLWDLKTQKLLFPESACAVQIAYSRKDNRCAVQSRESPESDSWIAIYDLNTAEQILEEREFFTSMPKRQLVEVTMNPSGTIAAARFIKALPDGLWDDCYLIINLKNSERQIVKRGSADPSHTFCFSADGTKLIVFAKQSARIYDVATSAILFEIKDCKHIRRDARDYPERLLLLRNDSTSLLNLSSTLPLQTVQLETLPMNSRIKGHWVGWIRDGKLTIRNLLDNAEYSTHWKSPDDQHIRLDESSWSMSQKKGMINISNNSNNLLFNTASNAFKEKSSHFYPESPNFSRGIYMDPPHATIHSLPDETPVATIALPATTTIYDQVKWSPLGDQFAVEDGNSVRLIQRIRPDEPGSMLWRFELWMTFVFGCGFVYSTFSDWNRFRAKSAS